jgi:chromosome segregation ATPase
MKKEKDSVLYDSIRERFYFLDDIVHSLEDRIEKANREIEEADKDMGRMKEEYEQVRKYLRELESKRGYFIDMIREFLEEVERA